MGVWANLLKTTLTTVDASLVTLDQLTTDSARRPSRSWLVATALLVLLATAGLVAGLQVNAEAQRPIGEGELFLNDGSRAVSALTGDPITTDALRRLRNDLTIEAVSLLNSQGVITASTSATLIDASAASPLVTGFTERGRFGAIAVPVVVPIEIDGVAEWMPGDIVYEVLQPFDSGGGVLLTYDVSELLTRRAASGGVPAAAIQLFGAAAVLLLLAVMTVVARNRVGRTYREFEVEAQYARREADALLIHNRELELARQRAELAFELAEEKNRIRSEFVLMINHELRTPLTGVVTGAQLLHSEGVITDETWSAVLENIVQDGNRLSEMIDQILSVARIENGALFFELHPVDIPEIFERLATATSRIEVERSTVGQSLSTDPTTLVNLLLSLADNAYSHGATRVNVRTSGVLPFEPMLEVGDRPDDAFYFIVEDDGPGIDLDFLPRAFEKFEKHSRSSGTGLGLYIARMMADALHASLITTTSPDGTSIAVALPRNETTAAAA